MRRYTFWHAQGGTYCGGHIPVKSKCISLHNVGFLLLDVGFPNHWAICYRATIFNCFMGILFWKTAKLCCGVSLSKIRKIRCREMVTMIIVCLHFAFSLSKSNLVVITVRFTCSFIHYPTSDAVMSNPLLPQCTWAACFVLTSEWWKDCFQAQRAAWSAIPLTPLSLSNDLTPPPPHPSCFPWCMSGRHWSVEAYNDARRNPRAWTFDENLFRVCECQVLSCPVLPHCLVLLVFVLPLCCPGQSSLSVLFLLLSKLHLICPVTFS